VIDIHLTDEPCLPARLSSARNASRSFAAKAVIVACRPYLIAARREIRRSRTRWKIANALSEADYY
jgi:hypothetical protein